MCLIPVQVADTSTWLTGWESAGSMVGMKKWILLVVMVAGCAPKPALRNANVSPGLAKALDKAQQPAPVVGKKAKAGKPPQVIGFKGCPVDMEYHNTYDTPPRVLTKVTPTYPEQARKQGIQGVVRMALVVGADGRVQHARVLCGHRELAAAAKAAALRMMFVPASLKGKPVEAGIPYKTSFVLD